MSLGHRKGFATVEDAMHSKVFLALMPDVVIDDSCPCGEVHVGKPPKAPKAAKPRKPLRAAKPGKQAKQRPASPRGSVAAAVRLVLAGQETAAAAARITGANPESVKDAAWETAKHLVRERDSHSCLNCGHAGQDVHHRVRRGMGSTADPVTAFGMANLVLVCRPCHALAHRADDPEMAVKGYRLQVSDDPASEPLWLFSELGGSMVWLTADGAYATAAPETAGAS